MTKTLLLISGWILVCCAGFRCDSKVPKTLRPEQMTDSNNLTESRIMYFEPLFTKTFQRRIVVSYDDGSTNVLVQEYLNDTIQTVIIQQSELRLRFYPTQSYCVYETCRLTPISRERFDKIIARHNDIGEIQRAINELNFFKNKGRLNRLQIKILKEIVVFTQLGMGIFFWAEHDGGMEQWGTRVISMSTIQPVTNEAELVDYIREFYEASFFPQGRFNKQRKQIEQWKWNNYRYMLGQVDDILRGLQKENTFYFYDNKDFTMLEFSYSVSPQGYISLQKDFINGQFYCYTTIWDSDISE